MGGLASSAQKVKCKDQNLFQSIQFVSLAPSSSEDDSWINKWPGSIGAPRIRTIILNYSWYTSALQGNVRAGGEATRMETKLIYSVWVNE